ncbi:MAG: prepilin-type N-terminal cleavage/methylation domain-containing protein [Candidatus Daviesbacteria bacterium]|nr:prepilin-type N-terminal cleavage/methylation domain-containing protein [Candidatus Daviesbacteria bacterium]
MNLKKTARGFTLVELLVVIAIIAILAAVVVLIINPLELTRRTRDASRLTDLANIQQAINVALQEGTAAGQASPACNSGTPDVTCTDNSIIPAGNTTKRLTNGGGWVSINFAGQSNVTVPTLPVDPTNTTPLHYTYCGSGTHWKIMTHLESEQQTTAPNDRRANDGGTDPLSYEVGSNMLLACTY